MPTQDLVVLFLVVGSRLAWLLSRYLGTSHSGLFSRAQIERVRLVEVVPQLGEALHLCRKNEG